ncbi:MAG: tRNA (adenosine(37)-N6)-dimethylallyltransferase MiaA [Candidatus Omnitrophica bacterium]|nr:tRNA (adenosine(37)-N6)-dimethylallyltransferase MiaA [Candidatus Omnitrophota bacterium]
MKPTLFFLVGPTAVGKTTLSISLAQRLNAEIICCDSMQIYKGMDILTSKPDLKQRHSVKHHLFSIIPVEKEFNVSEYRRLALIKVQEILKRNKVPLFVGGSGLYMSTVVDGIFELNIDSKLLRNQLLEQAKESGIGQLYERLKIIDPEAADKIHPNDLRRIIRALEVYETTGIPISKLQKQRKGLSMEYDIRIVGLTLERIKLYKNINERVEEMFNKGVVSEVRKLLSGSLSLTARKAIGIKEIEDYLNGKLSLEEAKELIKKNTRQYSRRQLTWFRKDKRIIWVDKETPDLLEKLVYIYTQTRL